MKCYILPSSSILLHKNTECYKNIAQTFTLPMGSICAPTDTHLHLYTHVAYKTGIQFNIFYLFVFISCELSTLFHTNICRYHLVHWWNPVKITKNKNYHRFKFLKNHKIKTINTSCIYTSYKIHRNISVKSLFFICGQFFVVFFFKACLGILLT